MASTSTLRIIIQALDEFSGELNKLRDSIQQIGRDLNKVSAAAKAAAVPLASIASTAPQYDKLSKSFAGLKSTIDQIVTPLGKVAASAAQATASLSALAGLAATFAQLNQTIIQLNANLSGVAAHTAAAGSAAKVSNNAFRDFAQQATAFQQVGIRLAVASAALIAAIAIPIQSAATFERSMARVIAVTEGGVAAFESMNRTAAELGRTTRYTATEVAQGMQFLGMAGFNAAETMSAIGPALTLASAGSMDLSRAADIATNIMTAMRVPVEELSHVIDVLAKTSVSSNTSVVQMSEALKYTAPLAKSAGVSLEEVSAAIGVLGNNGIQASLAGTSLRGIFLSLAAPTKRARDTLAEMGVTIARNEDGSINFINTLKRLRDANIDLSDANNLFLRRSAAGAVALAQQVEEVEKLTKANVNAVRAGQEMYNLMEDNLIGAYIRLTSAIEGFFIAIGEPTLAPLKAITLALANLVDGAAGLLVAFPDLALVFGVLAGSAGVVIGAIAALSVTIAGLVQVWRGLVYIQVVSWFTTITSAIYGAVAAIVTLIFNGGLLAAIITKLGVLATALSGLLTALAAAFVANPWTAALVAIGTLLATTIIRTSLFTRSIESLVDSEKKRVAAIDTTLKAYNELQRSMKKTENDAEANVEINLKMRKFLMETADANEDLSQEAREAAESIDIETGALNDATDALAKFKKTAESIKLDALVKQLVLYQGELRRARGEDKSPFIRLWEWNSLVIKQMDDAREALDHYGDDTYKFYSRIADVRNKEAEKLRETTQKIREDSKTIFEELEKVGNLSFNWSEDVFEDVLSSENIVDKKTVAIYKAEFSKLKEERNKLDDDMLESAIYKDDETLESLRKSVNDQIILLYDLGRAAQEALKLGDEGLASRIAADTVKAYDLKNRLSDEYYTELLKRQKEDLSALDDEIARRQKIGKIEADNLNLLARLPLISEKFIAVTAQKNAEQEAKTRKMMEDRYNLVEKIYKAEDQAIQEQRERKEDDINRDGSLVLISAEQVKTQLLQLAVETAEAEKAIADDRVNYVVKKYETETDVVQVELAKQEAAAKALADARLSLADDETRQKNKKEEQYARAMHKITMSRIQAEPESLTRIDKEHDEKVKLLKVIYSEEFQLGQEFELMMFELEQEAILKKQELVRKASAADKRHLEEETRAIRDLKILKLDEELNVSEFLYGQGEISLEEHYNNRRRITEAKLDAEIKQLREKLQLAQSVAEQNAVNAKINLVIEEKKIRTDSITRDETGAQEQNEIAIQHSLIDIRRKATQEWEFGEKERIEREAFALRQKNELDGFRKKKQEEINLIKQTNKESYLDAISWEEAETAFVNNQTLERKNFEDSLERDKKRRALSQSDRLIEEKMEATPEADFETRINLELEAYRNAQAQRLLDAEEAGAKEVELAELIAQQKIALDQRELDAARQIMFEKMNLWKSGFGALGDIFGGIYDASGGKLKEFAKMQKAMAIITTTISAIQAAQDVYALYSKTSMTLAVAMAAAALAAGMSRVAAIQAQPLAEGGTLGDVTHKDIVPIRVTAKEWKYPKGIVDEYGLKFFEAVQKREIPKNIANLLIKRKPPIRSQISLGSGYGEIKGTSPNDKADNILDRGRVGDFILPVRSAKFYGRDFMSAIYKGTIPKNWSAWLKQVDNKTFSVGGLISACSSVGSSFMSNANRLSFTDSNIKNIRLPSIQLPEIVLPEAYAIGGQVSYQSSSSNKAQRSAASSISVNVPVSVQSSGIDADRLGRKLQIEVENTVVRVLREHTR